MMTGFAALRCQPCSTSAPASRSALRQPSLAACTSRTAAARWLQQASLAAGAGRRHRRHTIVRSSLEEYVSVLEQCEKDGDWLRCVEVLTEVRVLKLDLPAASYEASIRTLCEGEQAQRAADLLRTRAAAGGGGAISEEVVTTVFETLSRAREGDAALQLFEEHYSDAGSPQYTPLLNIVIRACARGDRIDDALRLLNSVLMDDNVPIDYGTYNIVITECIHAGRNTDAEEVLEMRDYL